MPDIFQSGVEEILFVFNDGSGVLVSPEIWAQNIFEGNVVIKIDNEKTKELLEDVNLLWKWKQILK